MLNLLVVVLVVLIAPNLAHPARASNIVPPFRIAISTPSFPMHAPLFLTSNGSTSTSASDGAICYITSLTELFCGNNLIPITAPRGAAASLFSSIRPSEQAPHLGQGGGDMLGKGFSVEKESSRIRWDSEESDEHKVFVYKLDGSRAIWAVVENVTMVDSVGAELSAYFVHGKGNERGAGHWDAVDQNLLHS